MALSKKHRKASIARKIDGNRLIFQVRGPSPDGETAGPVIGEAVLDISKVHETLHREAEIHGWSQRIGDTAAMSQGSSAAEKLAAMQKLCDHYNSGTAEWSPTRTRAIGSDEVLLARVLAEVYTDRTAERIREYVAGLRAAERNAILAKFKDIADRIRAESATDVDAEELLKDL